MKYGKIVYSGETFKTAVCNYPTQFSEGNYEYGVFDSTTSESCEIATFLAKDDQEAVTKGLEIAKTKSLK